MDKLNTHTLAVINTRCWFLQGVAVELMRGSPAAGSDLDVGCLGHHRPALGSLPDPLRRFRLARGLHHRHGSLHPAT